MFLTNGGQKSGNRLAVLLATGLVLTDHIATDTLDDARLGITLVLELAQAEGEGAKLLLHLGEDLARSGTLEGVCVGGAAVQSRSLLKLLDLARAQADANLDTPDLTDLGDALALGALARRDDNLLGALNLVAVKEPRGRAFNNVAVVGLGDLLQKAGDLGLRGRLDGSSLGLLLFGAAGQKSRGDHQPKEELVDIVGGQEKVGSAALNDGLGSLLLGGDDGVANDGAEAIDLGTELDLDGLAGLDLSRSLLLVRLQGGVRSDKGSRGDGGGMRETYRWAEKSVSTPTTGTSTSSGGIGSQWRHVKVQQAGSQVGHLLTYPW